MDSLKSRYNNFDLKSYIKYDKLKKSIFSTDKNIIIKTKFGNNMIIKLLIIISLIDLILPEYNLFFFWISFFKYNFKN